VREDSSQPWFANIRRAAGINGRHVRAGTSQDQGLVNLTLGAATVKGFRAPTDLSRDELLSGRRSTWRPMKYPAVAPPPIIPAIGQ
jgi:hypothetical protein